MSVCIYLWFRSQQRSMMSMPILSFVPPLFLFSLFLPPFSNKRERRAPPTPTPLSNPPMFFSVLKLASARWYRFRWNVSYRSSPSSMENVNRNNIVKRLSICAPTLHQHGSIVQRLVYGWNNSKAPSSPPRAFPWNWKRKRGKRNMSGFN